jgi:hypothetical protein
MKRLLSVVLLVAVGFVFAWRQPVGAQTYPIYAGSFVVGLCSTVDYDAVVSRVLGITPADLRLALVSGQSLEELARNQKVDFSALIKALIDAHITEIDQAVSDGLLDKQQAEQMKTFLTTYYSQMRKNPTNAAGPAVRAYPALGPMPDVTAYNFLAVKVLMAAAQNLDLKCPDLVREVLNGRSVIAIVASRGGQVGPVIDAMLKAYQDALDQDVKEQLITVAQSKGFRVQLAERVAMVISQPGQAMVAQILSLPGQMPGYPYQAYPGPYVMQGVASGAPNAQPGTSPVEPDSSTGVATPASP